MKSISDEVTIVQILFGVTLGICLLITLSACFVKNPSGKINKSIMTPERNHTSFLDAFKCENIM